MSDVTEIEDRIEETREELAATVDALHDRVSPRRGVAAVRARLPEVVVVAVTAVACVVVWRRL